MGKKSKIIFRISRLWLPILYSSTTVIIIYNHFFYDFQPAPSPILSKLNDLQKESLGIITMITNLLFSLSTALFGAIGIFVVQKFKDGGSLSQLQRRNAISAFAFAALSIDFGYIFLEKWVELLANGIFVPFEKFITIPQTLQFSTFLIALIFFAMFVLTEIKKGEKE